MCVGGKGHLVPAGEVLSLALLITRVRCRGLLRCLFPNSLNSNLDFTKGPVAENEAAVTAPNLEHLEISCTVTRHHARTVS